VNVLVAVDGSSGSRDAARLVRSMAWPPATAVHLFSVVDPRAWIPPGPDVPDLSGLVDPGDVIAYYEAQQLAIRDEFAGTALEVLTTVVRGRPAEAIVVEALRLEAGLIAVGSRGHGKIATLVLGSVSAEVVDQAPGPVLVARHPERTRVLLAVDGSPSAGAAARIAASWPAFDGVPIEVVAVAEATRPWTVGIAPAFMVQARDAYERELHSATAEAREVVTEAVAGLRRVGRDARATVLRGPVASEIITAVGERNVDMVVIGARGRTASMIFVGSVARDVLLASAASVMVVRESAAHIGPPGSR
jgi:nucleotide-binding universal stress UspA family protein